MDESRFDSTIKAKLENFEPATFDPAALAALHHHMAAQTVVPWYRVYRSELFTAGCVTLAATVIIFSQWWFTSKNGSRLESELKILQDQAAQVDQLQHKLNELTSAPRDTVRIIEVRTESATAYLRLVKRIAQLEAELDKWEKAYLINGPVPKAVAPNVASLDGTPAAVDVRGNARINPRTSESESEKASPKQLPMDVAKAQRSLSAKTVRDIQQHYQKGLGVRLGPALSLTHGSYDLGTGRYDLGIGLLTDLILSPSLSLETGVNYTLRHNRVQGAQLTSPGSFPGTDLSLGEVQNIDVESWIWEIPINLRYRYPISLQSNWLATVGYSNPIYSLQVLEHSYRSDPGQAAMLSTNQRYETPKLYAGTLNLGLGYAHELENKKIIETSIIYQHGLGTSGVERTLPSFLGIRGVYYFKVK